MADAKTVFHRSLALAIGTEDLYGKYKQKKGFLWVMEAAQVAETHGDNENWPELSHRSFQAAEAPSLNMLSLGIFLMIIMKFITIESVKWKRASNFEVKEKLTAWSEFLTGGRPLQNKY